MRYLLVTLALCVAAVRATPPDLSDADRVASDHVLISSGRFKYDSDDHPESDEEGKIVGTGDIGKSTFLSTDEFLAGTGQNPKRGRDYHIIRPSHATALKLQVKADAGDPAKDGRTLPAGHVSIGLSPTHETTRDELTKTMNVLQSNSVRGNGETDVNKIVAMANAQTDRSLTEIKKEVDSEKKAAAAAAAKEAKAAAKAAKQPKEGDKSGGGGAVGSPAAVGGDGDIICKRDGSFCTLGNRPKKPTVTGKNAASTVTKKTAGNPKSQKAATAASKKPTTGSKTRLASSKDKAITGKKTVKGSTGKPVGSKKDKKASSKQSMGSKKGSNTKLATAAAGKGPNTKKAGTTTKASASGKGASSRKATTATKLKKPATGKKGPNTKKAGMTTKASADGKGASSRKATTTTKLKKPATGKKGSTTKKPAAMAGTKSTAGQKLVAKPAAGSSKKQTSAASSPSKKLSSSVGGNAAKPVAPAAKSAKSATKRIHRRDLTMNRPRMVYEAMQGYKRGLMQESTLDELD